jgi:transposase
MKNEGDIRLSIRQARKLHVLEEVTCGRMTHREASAALGLSVRQVQRIKASFKEAGASSLVHGNAGRKPSHYVSCAVRNLVAERARSLWKGASARHMSELLLAEEGCSVSSKTITRILKETGLKSPLSHKGARKQKEKDPDGALRTDASDRRLSLRLALEGFDDLPSRRHR